MAYSRKITDAIGAVREAEGRLDTVMKTLSKDDVQAIMRNSGYNDTYLSAAFVRMSQYGHFVYQIAFRYDGEVETGNVYLNWVRQTNGDITIMGDY